MTIAERASAVVDALGIKGFVARTEALQVVKEAIVSALNAAAHDLEGNGIGSQLPVPHAHTAAEQVRSFGRQ
jgi:hypothetical protein